MKRKLRVSTIVLCAAVCLMGMLFARPIQGNVRASSAKLTLNRKQLTLYVGESRQLSAKEGNQDGASASVRWRSDKKKVASVSQAGRVTAKKQGKAKITAISKKNPRLQKTITVMVRKRPKRVEKACVCTGSVHALTSGEYTAWKRAMEAEKIQGDAVTIHTKEDFQAWTKLLKKMGMQGYKKTFLKAYANMDYKKDSLVFLEFSTYRGSERTLQSVTAGFDAAGKLCGAVELQHEALPEEPGVCYPQVMDENMLVLKMKKKDAAMIDYFKCTDEEKK